MQVLARAVKKFVISGSLLKYIRQKERVMLKHDIRQLVDVVLVVVVQMRAVVAKILAQFDLGW